MDDRAYKQAVKQAIPIYKEVVGSIVGAVPESVQRKRWERFKNDSEALYRWVSAYVGPERASVEAQNYRKAMVEKYGL